MHLYRIYPDLCCGGLRPYGMLGVDGYDGRHLPGVPLHARMFLKVRFAQDSPLEEDRSELPVPPKTTDVRAVALSRSRRLSLAEKLLPDLLDLP